MEFLEAKRRAELRFDGRRCDKMCFPFGVKTHAASLARIKIIFLAKQSEAKEYEQAEVENQPDNRVMCSAFEAANCSTFVLS